MPAEVKPMQRLWDSFVYHVWRQIILTEHPAMERFFARRCPHLAGMIAYFAILSVIPAAFVFVSALGWAGALQAQGWIVSQLTQVMPEQAANTITRNAEFLRERSGSIGLIGVIGLVWGVTNFFSCIESALNIIHGVNNRPFIKQKAWVTFLMVVASAVMSAAIAGFVIVLPLLERTDWINDGVLHNSLLTDRNLSIIVSGAFAFVFFLSCYRFLPNAPVRTKDCWLGALIAAVVFEISIHVLPVGVSSSPDSAIFNAFAGALILLLWFYLMSFVLLAGGVFSWWWAARKTYEYHGIGTA